MYTAALGPTAATTATKTTYLTDSKMKNKKDGIILGVMASGNSMHFLKGNHD